jgi:hypothetical protein
MEFIPARPMVVECGRGRQLPAVDGDALEEVPRVATLVSSGARSRMPSNCAMVSSTIFGLPDPD